MKSHSKARTIITDYHNGDTFLRRTASVHVSNACMNCVGHLQSDEYGATYAIVYDAVRGLDHAIFRRSPSRIIVLYKRKVP
jgi:hypothetical protein